MNVLISLKKEKFTVPKHLSVSLYVLYKHMDDKKVDYFNHFPLFYIL